MPKSRVRKKAVYTPPKEKPTPQMIKASGPSHPAYIGVMLGFMVLGLVWLVTNYLAGDKLGFMVALGGAGNGFNYNFLVGFGLIIIGLLMTMRWR
ncbi:cell division protein CrgA [Pseudonocardia acaciae]|uniref:cell division protein CrgA n=1 Tax=Pseudonocardia acaciae TaxID=551276 RepID=UPI00048D7AEC|nr:cell division protein CrgA [Pseudonocardia acaciae]